MDTGLPSLPFARLSRRLERTLDQLERVTAAVPSDDGLIEYLIESGELDRPVKKFNA